MKKYLAIFLSFIIIFSVSLVAVQVYAMKSCDTVRYTEHTISGDKRELEGIHVDLKLACNNRLFWNVGYTMGENEKYDVTFEHYYDRQRSQINSKPDFYLSVGFLNFSSSHRHDVLDDISLFGQYDMIVDVASRAPAGTTYKEIVYLRDYYEYYPITYSLDINDAHCNENYTYDNYPGTKYDEMFTAIQNRFEEYFKIPILPTAQREITIEKRSDGTVASVNSNSPNGNYDIEIYCGSFISDNAIYFLINAYSDDNTEIEQLDISKIGDGYGIYRLPYEVLDYEGQLYEANTYTNVKIDELELVYPIEEGIKVEEIALSENQSEIYLTTRQSGENEDNIMLSVIDVATKTDRQSTLLFSCNRDVFVSVKSYHDNFILYNIGYEKFAVIENVDGTWRTAFIVDDESINELWWSSKYETEYFNTTSAYDGERLIIATYSNEIGGNGLSSAESYLASFYLSIYSADGNLYTGKFTSSLDTGTFLAYNNICRPAVDNKTLVLKVQ